MGTVLLVIVVVVVVAAVGFAVALARKGKRQFEASTGGPGLAPNAPREWAGAHSPEAKLHRRLASAARSLDALPVGDAVSIERRVAIEQQILQLDQQLVAMAGARGDVAGLEPLVSGVERAVAQLATSGVDMEMLMRNQAELDAGESER